MEDLERRGGRSKVKLEAALIFHCVHAVRVRRAWTGSWLYGQVAVSVTPSCDGGRVHVSDVVTSIIQRQQFSK